MIFLYFYLGFCALCYFVLRAEPAVRKQSINYAEELLTATISIIPVMNMFFTFDALREILNHLKLWDKIADFMNKESIFSTYKEEE